jgi:hypothetical protein
MVTITPSASWPGTRDSGGTAPIESATAYGSGWTEKVVRGCDRTGVR